MSDQRTMAALAALIAAQPTPEMLRLRPAVSEPTPEMLMLRLPPKSLPLSDAYSYRAERGKPKRSGRDDSRRRMAKASRKRNRP